MNYLSLLTTCCQHILNSKKKDKDEIKKRVEYILERLGIYRYRHRPCSMLSGGERQRIILARSILYNPKILILDESLSEIDKTTELEILSNIDKYLLNTTIIYISHSNTNYFNKENANFYFLKCYVNTE